jgi:hypothetical protein
MPGKRSRLTRSQSFGDIGLGNDRLPPRDGGFTADNMAGQFIRRIIAVSPPPPLLPEKEKDIGDGLMETEHFLERCEHCWKRLSQKQDVYMYGYGFVSPYNFPSIFHLLYFLWFISFYLLLICEIKLKYIIDFACCCVRGFLTIEAKKTFNQYLIIFVLF